MYFFLIWINYEVTSVWQEAWPIPWNLCPKTFSQKHIERKTF